jgi:hypothetical protein
MFLGGNNRRHAIMNLSNQIVCLNGDDAKRHCSSHLRLVDEAAVSESLALLNDCFSRKESTFHQKVDLRRRRTMSKFHKRSAQLMSGVGIRADAICSETPSPLLTHSGHHGSIGRLLRCDTYRESFSIRICS